MLLRRITEHIKNQNWFAVFLDFVIVVAGVFIGIQVANWNEAVAGEKRAKLLLSRIYDDLNNDFLALNSELDYLSSVHNYAMQAVETMNNPVDVDYTQFLIAAYQASQVNGVWSNRSTYNEMLSTGDANLFKEIHLKKAIFGYYSSDFTAIPTMTKLAPYRQYIRGKLPVVMQQAIKENCGDVVVKMADSIASILPAKCELNFPLEIVEKIATDLISDEEMLPNLRNQIAINDAKAFTLRNQAAESKALMQLLKSYRE